MNELELDDDELESLKDLIAYVGGRIPEEHYSQRENFNAVIDALDMDYLDDLDVPDEWRVGTDGGRDLPRTYGPEGEESFLDAFDEVRPGDRVLWGDRKQPATVARVVEPDDAVGQSLTASVLRRDPEAFRGNNQPEKDYEVGRDLEQGDVFLSSTPWNLTGRRFLLIHGPRGGFYAIAEPGPNHSTPALFRVVRSFHKTRMGQPGQGAWDYETEVETFEVVEEGDEPDELDPEGDLPAYEDIRENVVVGYDSENDEVGHVEVGTVEEVVQEGIEDAHSRALDAARNELPTVEEDPGRVLPSVERIEGTPEGYSHSTVTVTGVFSEDDRLRATLDTPAPWETPDDETPANEVLKSTPYGDVEYMFDSDREEWVINASELSKVASVFRSFDYSVYVEDDALELPE